MKKPLAFLAVATAILTICSQGLQAQVRSGVTVSGHITDKATGETLIGAGVTSGSLGAATNTYGFYTLTLPYSDGLTTMKYSYVGYEDVSVSLRLKRDTVINIALTAGQQLSEAVVAAARESGIMSTKMSAIEIPMTILKNTPTLFGEADVLKTIQLMPGVQAGTEGLSGIYVRGGGPDENLLLLDGIPLYNVDHMLGLFSVFQPEAVKNVTLYKGSFPARYGGRTSSIIDVRTNDGNLYETHGSLGIGLLNDNFHIEGPIAKGKTAYSVSLRGLHTFLFEGAFQAFDVPGNYYFYDFNAKLSHKFSDSDRLFFNFYNGRDRFYVDYDDKGSSGNQYGDLVSWNSKDRTKMNWGNTLASLRWNHIFTGKLFANVTAAYTKYSMKMGYNSKYEETADSSKETYDYDFSYNSGIQDFTAKIDFDYTPVPSNLIKFGAEYVNHTFIPETYSTQELESIDGTQVIDTTYSSGHTGNRSVGHEISVYAEDDITLAKWLTINPGIRLSLFAIDGEEYLSPEPRISVKADIWKGLSFKAAYSEMYQYVHLLSSSTITLPLDLWVPITKEIAPVHAKQYSAGLYYSGLKGWEFSVEGYWKDMENILEYKDGVSFLASSTNWDENVAMGIGRAYGVELFIQKTMGKTTGWLGYTLSKSERRFPDGTISNGEWYPYRYDRRHNIALVVNQKLGKRWDVSATWTYATGGTTTIPERTIVSELPDGSFVEIDYSPHRNNYRLPASHRLNIGANFHKQKRRGESIWNISLYNAYNRLNPNFVFYSGENRHQEITGSNQRRIELTAITILPIIPSIGYTYKF